MRTLIVTGEVADVTAGRVRLAQLVEARMIEAASIDLRRRISPVLLGHNGTATFTIGGAGGCVGRGIATEESLVFQLWEEEALRNRDLCHLRWVVLAIPEAEEAYIESSSEEARNAHNEAMDIL